MVVIDPGHAPTIQATDPRTGLNASEYENEPEMRDVFAVAQLVASKLRAEGYRVLLTKPTLRSRITLAQRAAVANKADADLALSIHDQAGADGGIGFDSGNNIVYYQSVGTYRQNPAGKKIVFTDHKVAALSKKYGKIFQKQRERVHGVSVRLQGNVGYNLGTRGLAPGNIWTVQLLSDVPWIYNEAGGNSPGMVGLSDADKRTYANGLVAAVTRCLPIHH